MALLHIPVRILAEDPAESQAFQDVMAGEGAGALALASEGEAPMAVLVCPSGQVSGADGLPSVVLGPHAQTPDGARCLDVPARLSDVLEALEGVANAASGFTAPRSLGAWALEPSRLTLSRGDDHFSLTETELRLLACLFDARGAVVSRDTLLSRVWGYRPGLDTHTLETHIYRLRKKIEADPASPAIIVTEADGYRFAS